MAKRRKSKGKRRGGKKKKGVSRASKRIPAAVGAGLSFSAYKALFEPTRSGGPVIDAVMAKGVPLRARVTDVANRAKAIDLWNVALPTGAGLLVHWGKNKPVLKIVGKPLNDLSKKLFGRPL